MAFTPSMSDSDTLVGSPTAYLPSPSSTIIKDEFPEDEETTISRLSEERQKAIRLQQHCKFEEAGEHYNSILECFLRLFGDSSQPTVTAKEDVGVNLAQRGYYDQAQKVFQTVLGQREMAWTDSFPVTSLSDDKACARQARLAIADANYNLANVLRAQHLYEDAAMHYSESLAIQLESLNGPSYSSLCSLAGLSKTYIWQEMFNDAEVLIQDIKEGYKIVCKEENMVNKLMVMDRSLDALLVSVTQNEAIISDLRGNIDEAKVLFLQSWEDIQAIRPRDHPDTLETAFNIATFFERHGDFDNAIHYYRIARASTSEEDN